MKASKILIDAIKSFEGCKLKAYRCPAGVPTIGYGSTVGVKMGMEITLAQAEKMLTNELAKFEKGVNALGVAKTQGQFDALVDFSYNLGLGALKNSTLLKKIKANRPAEEIQAQFKLWCHAGGKVLPGLVKRRNWEASRWIQ